MSERAAGMSIAAASIPVSPAETTAEFAAFRRLIAEYVEWCRALYSDDADFVDRTLSHQSLADELRDLSSAYGPPRGHAFVAWLGSEPCGCGAWRDLGEGVCEMKRLFVPDRFRGRGVGSRLGRSLIGSARAAGHKLMRLDTLSRMEKAIAMYEAIGFRRCAPYHDYPEDLMARIVFMELPLSGGQEAAP